MQNVIDRLRQRLFDDLRNKSMLEDLKVMKIENNNNLKNIYNSISQSLNKCVYSTGDW